MRVSRKLFVIAMLLVSNVMAAADDEHLARDNGEYFNILSVDGGGIRGLIPAQMLKMVETYAYNYVKEKGYEGVPVYHHNETGEVLKLVHMKDLFNMTAGTSTGSIISAGLAFPREDEKDKPKYYMKDLLEIYSTLGDQIFQKNELTPGVHFAWVLLFLSIFGGIGYYIGLNKYDNPDIEAQFETIEENIKEAIRLQNTPPSLNAESKENQWNELANRKTFKKKVKDLNNAKKYMDTMSKNLIEKVEIEQNKESQQSSVQSALRKIKIIDNYFIQKTLQQEGEDHLDQVLEKMIEAKLKYNQGRPKKWIVTFVFVLLGFFIGGFVPWLTNLLGNSLYDRKNIDKIMMDYLGSERFDNVLTDELLVVAYEYNQAEPRFFSKYFSHQNPAKYDVIVGEATAASSAAPTYFDPKIGSNKYEQMEIQIDGGIICNNPAMYAYQMARGLRGEKKIRVLSLGTGEKTFTPIKTVNDYSKFDQLSKIGETMMNMDSYTAHWYLKNEYTHVEKQAEDYLRCQTSSNIGMDKVDKKSIDGLIADGTRLYNENSEALEKMIRTIIDERWGPDAKK